MSFHRRLSAGSSEEKCYVAACEVCSYFDMLGEGRRVRWMECSAASSDSVIVGLRSRNRCCLGRVLHVVSGRRDEKMKSNHEQDLFESISHSIYEIIYLDV